MKYAFFVNENKYLFAKLYKCIQIDKEFTEVIFLYFPNYNELLNETNSIVSKM